MFTAINFRGQYSTSIRSMQKKNPQLQNSAWFPKESLFIYTLISEVCNQDFFLFLTASDLF
jgi:hypothetical protein